MVPRACNTRLFKIMFDSVEIFNFFRICSASDEIHSTYAQCAMKFIPRMLSMDVQVKTVHILPLDEHAQIFVPRILSVWWNSFLIRSVCNKIVSTYAQHAFFFFYQIKMQILTLNDRNFEKLSRNPSYRTKVKILWKFFWIYHQQKFDSTHAQSQRKFSTIEILAKTEGKEQKFFFEYWPRAYKVLI